jgi:hypothetical protein
MWYDFLEFNFFAFNSVMNIISTFPIHVLQSNMKITCAFIV